MQGYGQDDEWEGVAVGDRKKVVASLGELGVVRDTEGFAVVGVATPFSGEAH